MRASESELSVWILCGYLRECFVSVVCQWIRYGVIGCVLSPLSFFTLQMEVWMR